MNRWISSPVEVVKQGIFLLLRGYKKFLSPVIHLLPGRGCKYYPSCSEYCMECFDSMPLWKAFFKSIWRLFRCNPFSKGGVDFPHKRE